MLVGQWTSEPARYSYICLFVASHPGREEHLKLILKAIAQNNDKEFSMEGGFYG
jgi:hypothetical protein